MRRSTTGGVGAAARRWRIEAGNSRTPTAGPGPTVFRHQRPQPRRRRATWSRGHYTPVRPPEQPDAGEYPDRGRLGHDCHRGKRLLVVAVQRRERPADAPRPRPLTLIGPRPREHLRRNVPYAPTASLRGGSSGCGLLVRNVEQRVDGDDARLELRAVNVTPERPERLPRRAMLAADRRGFDGGSAKGLHERDDRAPCGQRPRVHTRPRRGARRRTLPRRTQAGVPPFVARLLPLPARGWG
jgi:hypothetical protein